MNEYKIITCILAASLQTHLSAYHLDKLLLKSFSPSVLLSDVKSTDLCRTSVEIVMPVFVGQNFGNVTRAVHVSEDADIWG